MEARVMVLVPALPLIEIYPTIQFYYSLNSLRVISRTSLKYNKRTCIRSTCLNCKLTANTVLSILTV